MSCCGTLLLLQPERTRIRTRCCLLLLLCHAAAVFGVVW
jgi:hypothetical protein